MFPFDCCLLALHSEVAFVGLSKSCAKGGPFALGFFTEAEEGVMPWVLGSRVSGRSQCRVGAFGVSGLRESDFLFIAISHCAWRRHFLVLSDKETKQRKRFNRTTLSVHSVQFSFIGAPKARCSPERRMFEPLLLANPDIDTLRHQCSRASTLAKEPAQAHAFELLGFLVG